MSTPDIRAELRELLLTIPGLGGPGQADARHIHQWAFECDDEHTARSYWQSTEGGKARTNGVMITRVRRVDRELVAGQEFATIHTFRLIFRYGDDLEPRAEERFEKFVDAIHEKLKGSAFFTRNGLHPLPEAEQTARTNITNKKLFGTRTWEAEIEFDVVEREFRSP